LRLISDMVSGLGKETGSLERVSAH
jgi:hypothetical protein